MAKASQRAPSLVPPLSQHSGLVPPLSTLSHSTDSLRVCGAIIQEPFAMLLAWECTKAL